MKLKMRLECIDPSTTTGCRVAFYDTPLDNQRGLHDKKSTTVFADVADDRGVNKLNKRVASSPDAAGTSVAAYFAPCCLQYGTPVKIHTSTTIRCKVTTDGRSFKQLDMRRNHSINTTSM